jgi:Tfp pilus assembly protein FimT
MGMTPVIHGAAGKTGRRAFGAAGFSIPELVIFVAVVGVLFAMSIPSFVTYYQAAALRSDVQQVITLFNQARELAIKQNDTVCVTMPTGSQLALRLGSCAGAVWTGPGTDGVGNMNLPQGFTIAPLTGVTFNYLGAAGAATTYIMTNTTTNATSTISVSLSGRVTSP